MNGELLIFWNAPLDLSVQNSTLLELKSNAQHFVKFKDCIYVMAVALEGEFA